MHRVVFLSTSFKLYPHITNWLTHQRIMVCGLLQRSGYSYSRV